MKKVKGSLLAKLTAIFLLIAMVLIFAASLLGVLFMVELDFYSDSFSAEAVLGDMGYHYLWRMAGTLESILQDQEAPSEELLDISVSPDFRYTLYDTGGNTLFDSLSEVKTLWRGSLTLHREFDHQDRDGELIYRWYWGSSDTIPEPSPRVSIGGTASSEEVSAEDEVTPAPTALIDSGSRTAPAKATPSAEPEEDDSELQAMIAAGERQYTLVGGIPTRLTPNGNVQRLWTLASWGYGMRYSAIGIAVGSLLLGILLFIFLMCAAGHRDGTDTVTPNFVDKLPFDLFFAVIAVGFAFPAVLGINLLFEIGSIDHAEGVLALCVSLGLFIAAVVLAILFCMSLATRLKLGTVIKSCLCYRLLVWCWRIAKAILSWCGRAMRGMVRMAGKLFRSIPMLRRAILIMAALLFVEFFWMAIFQYEFGGLVFGWFVERAALVLTVLYGLLCLRRLQKGAKEIARGNMDYVVDTRYMRGDFKEAAEDLNSIRDGMTRAVNERMKSEHFKTELITNVSHDIKTPLTSIVNYVDLLSKEEPENEQMKEYIEVLSRQSARLKKLIDDLIEASKASTGNLSVNLERCELGVLLDQTVGEYAEKLAAANLELVIKKPEEPITVMADGRHTWRIFDNLMNNICKYAQPGTRVYLNLEKNGNKAAVTFRNISRSQLNISGDELMERFVRGDSSRNTEGSGLGLSIARSLAQLQRSDLELTVDGDLFKVTLSFDAAL